MNFWTEVWMLTVKTWAKRRNKDGLLKQKRTLHPSRDRLNNSNPWTNWPRTSINWTLETIILQVGQNHWNLKNGFKLCKVLMVWKAKHVSTLLRSIHRTPILSPLISLQVSSLARLSKSNPQTKQNARLIQFKRKKK